MWQWQSECTVLSNKLKTINGYNFDTFGCLPDLNVVIFPYFKFEEHSLPMDSPNCILSF